MFLIILIIVVALLLVYLFPSQDIEGFYPYLPCIYTAQNDFWCNPILNIPGPYMQPTKYTAPYDLRGDPFFRYYY